METTEQTDIVCLPRWLADTLDYGLSPMDGIIAIGQVYQDLPVVHRQFKPRPRWFHRRNSVRVYRAHMDWCGAVIEYVERDGRLYVIDVWFYSARDREVPKADCIFDEVTDIDRYVVQGRPVEADAG